MAISSGARFHDLMSVRARIGWKPGGGGLHRFTGGKYGFGSGKPDPASFPYEGMIEATKKMLAAEGAEAMTYGEPQGYLGLRELIRDKYERFEGLKVGSENIQVANGSGQALSLAFSAFVDVGDPILCEAPTFHGTLQTIRRHGAEVHDAPIDDEGIQTSVVREKLEALRRQGRRCKLIYTMPNFQNPGGPTMSLGRRRELVALAREYQTLILEDDAYGELRFEGEQLPSLYALDDSGGVIRAGTLSKILGAGVRLGWVCAPAEMVPVLQNFCFGGGVNPYMSRVATYYLRDHLESHVELLVDIYREKRDAMRRGLLEALEGTDAEINTPEGGFFLWLKLPSRANRNQFAELAQEAGVTYVPGTACFANGGGEQYIRLAFSFDPLERCYEGARLVGRCIREAML